MRHIGSAFFWRGMRIVGMVIFGVLAAACFGLLFGLIIQALWNWLMPAVFGLPTINYWQAFGLVLLTRILFGTMGIHGERHTGGHLHERWERSEDWEWDDCSSWRKWRYYDEWWHAEGRAAYARYVESKKTPVNTVDED